MKRSPMSQGTGFARKAYTPPPAAPLRRVERAGVLANCRAMGLSIAKTEPHRNRRLLDLARGMPCLLRVPGICNGNPETTVACHSNLGVHEKGGARKADDEYSVWGCGACHEWLDRGPADALIKEATFMRAHLQQVLEWRQIAEFDAHADADRAAARWALAHLNATPVELESPL